MKLFKLLARLFSPETEEVVKEKIARVKTDPRVSEPVFMMMESIRKHPERWRVKLLLPEYNPDETRRMRIRLQDYTTTMPLDVQITDRGVGESYYATIEVPISLVERLSLNKAMRRATTEDDLVDLVMAKHVKVPNWLNDVEARELHNELSKMLYDRVKKVIDYANRQAIRQQKEREVERDRIKMIERERLIKLYGGKHNA